jgi:undecaprenyl-diphosphatase
MDYTYTIFKGILQGLTEFLPVSSTAHLVLTDHWWLRLFGTKPPTAEAEFFDIMLHLGTLSAVLFYYRKDLAGLFSAKSRLIPSVLPVWQLVGLSTVVTVVWILGWLKGSEVVMTQLHLVTTHVSNLSDWIMETPTWVAAHLLVTGTLLFWTEKQRQKADKQPRITQNTHTSAGITPKAAAWIGLAQGCAAIFHGLSRSGSTISMGLLCGLDRVTATQYAFVLSIPTFIMATVYECLKLMKLGHLDNLNWPPMLAGVVCSALVGYVCIKGFLQFVGRYPLTGFAVYCWAMGLIMLVTFGLFPA